MVKRHSLHQHSKTGDSRGQALVEFSMIVLAFITLLMGVIEFGLAFNAKLQTSFASRDAAVAAAESGGTPNTADGAILNTIDRDINTPLQRAYIDHVDVYWANADGSVHAGAIERYTPGGSLYPGWGGWTKTLDLYPGPIRCAFISGCAGSPAHPGPDRMAVLIAYRYSWTTPLPNLVGLFGTGVTFVQTNLVTMEPIPNT
jgi:hypothetical protein